MIPSLPGLLHSASGAAAFAALDPSNKTSGLLLTGANLTATASQAGVYQHVYATIGKTSGKWSFEITYNNVAGAANNKGVHGIARTANFISYPGQSIDSGIGFWHRGGAVDNYIYLDSSTTTININNNDPFINQTVHFSIDMDTMNFTVTSTQGTASLSYVGQPTDLPYLPKISLFDLNSCTVNFGASAFVFPVLSGYNPGWYQ